MSKPYRERIIVLDPGHGSTRGVLGYDPGCTSGDRTEADANLEAVATLKVLLVARGFRVVLTHDGTDGPKPDLSWRVRMAAGLGAAALISVHWDQVFKPSRHRSGVYYAPGEPSRKLAQAVAPHMAQGDKSWCEASTHSRFGGLYIDAFPDARPAILLELDSLQHAPPTGTAGKVARLAMLTPIADAIARAL
ncbi:N-acetylmuramoyl-L-alanine amidase family protein [Deinococcus kurensis]|uniref:N-acetylmuramoyl-L-alanine amidase family protein n=1 Tax=Deinococcus kurensis TaxID=2662757 RepID=UPI0012D33F14|nr:N-acetylmuramoyl-L-alanine amidase [Deinococcus kurensis]